MSTLDKRKRNRNRAGKKNKKRMLFSMLGSVGFVFSFKAVLLGTVGNTDFT